MEIRIVIDGISYEFNSYCELRELLDAHAAAVSETSDDAGVYFA